MQPDTFQTKNAIQWEDLVTFRKRAETIARETGTLAQDINKDVYYSYEDRPEVGDATSRLRFTTGQVVAARKFHLKRTVKTRKLGSGTSSKKPAQKEEHDEYQGVVKYTESPSWLLEPDGDEVSPLLASPFHYELIKRTLQPSQCYTSTFSPYDKNTDYYLSSQYYLPICLKGRLEHQLWPLIRQQHYGLDRPAPSPAACYDVCADGPRPCSAGDQ